MGEMMKTLFSSVIVALFCLPCFAQEATPVGEPPIPVYIIHENNHGSLTTNDSVLHAREMDYSRLQKNYDSLQVQLHQARMQTMSEILWLSVFIAVMAIISIASLIVSIKLKKELASLRHIVNTLPMHQAEEKTDVPSMPELRQELTEPLRTPRTRSTKPSSRRKKK
jgi:hypothetical protein